MPNTTPNHRGLYFVLAAAAVMGAQIFGAWLATRPAAEMARATNAELLQAERLNAEMHATAKSHREALERVQAANAGRIDANTRRVAGLEAEVKALKAEMKAAGAGAK